MSAHLPVFLLLLACGATGLLLTLALAARCTPGAWWRRPNARALSVLVLGTGLVGGALWLCFAPARPVAIEPVAAMPDLPLAGRSYRVADALNLRAERGTGARRMLVLPAGTLVEATGRRDGDWWQVTAQADGRRYEGWASSLWLRRADERRP